jgi:protein STE50
MLNTTLEHKIQGDSLCELDSEGLKSLGITTIGQRLSILKSIYLVKLAHDVPMDENHYVPPCKSFYLFPPSFFR